MSETGEIGHMILPEDKGVDRTLKSWTRVVYMVRWWATATGRWSQGRAMVPALPVRRSLEMKKLVWAEPALIPLAEVERGDGACTASGSGDTGNCLWDGNSADIDCYESGNTPDNVCFASGNGYS